MPRIIIIIFTEILHLPSLTFSATQNVGKYILVAGHGNKSQYLHKQCPNMSIMAVLKKTFLAEMLVGYIFFIRALVSEIWPALKGERLEKVKEHKPETQ